MKKILNHLILIFITSILFYYTVSLFHIIDVIYRVILLLLPFLIALLIHLLIDPLIDFFTNERINRKIVVIHVYLTFSLFGILTIVVILPMLIEGCQNIFENMSSMSTYPLVNQMIQFIESHSLFNQFFDMISKMTSSFIFWITNILLGAGIAFYLSIDNLHLIDLGICYLPFKIQSKCSRYLKLMKLRTLQFMKSLLLDFFYFFFLCLIPFFFVDNHLFIYIALFLSVTNLIPYIGPYIGAIPIVIYEYMIDPYLGYSTLIIIAVLQYLESNFLQPYLFKRCINLHPLYLFIALSIFGDLLGIIGMIFSPLFAVYFLLTFKFLKDLDFLYNLKKWIKKYEEM